MEGRSAVASLPRRRSCAVASGVRMECNLIGPTAQFSVSNERKSALSTQSKLRATFPQASHTRYHLHEWMGTPWLLKPSEPGQCHALHYDVISKRSVRAAGVLAAARLQSLASAVHRSSIACIAPPSLTADLDGA